MPSKAPKPPASPPSVTRPDEGDGSVVAERKAAKTKPPRMYQVVMLNDDFTPMEFVVMVLQVFSLPNTPPHHIEDSPRVGPSAASFKDVAPFKWGAAAALRLR
jgi:hypothetical protein